MTKKRKPYKPKPIKNTLALFADRDKATDSEVTGLQLTYRQIFERVRCGNADEKDFWAMAAMLEDVHIAVEYSDELSNKEATFAQLRAAYTHIRKAVDLKRAALTAVGFEMLRDALELHEGIIKNSSKYVIKQMVRCCEARAKTGMFKVAA